MTAQTIVKFSRPQPGEEELRFILVEDNGDRVLIELVCDLPFPPRECVAKSEITAVSAARHAGVAAFAQT